MQDLNDHRELKLLIADRLINARTLAHKSQREISKLMGKSPAWLSQIESGIITIGTEDLIKISAIYGTTPGQIIDLNPTLVTGNLPLNEILDSFYMKISNNLPVEVPVYLHSAYTFNTKSKPIDYAYWSRNKISNREIFIIHAQTNNCSPEILIDDRVVIQSSITPRPGLGAIWFLNREAFGTPGLGIVRIIEKDGHLYYWGNPHINKKNEIDYQPLHQDRYIGNIVQIIRALDNTIDSRLYKRQENYEQEGANVKEWSDTKESPIKAPRTAIISQDD